MQILVFKLIFVLVSLVLYANAAATMTEKNLAAAALHEVCRQLKVCTGEPAVSFELFGMSSAFMILKLQEPPRRFMQRLHDMASPFSQFTRVGNQVFYSAAREQISLQLVVDVLGKNTTEALLSAIIFDLAQIGTSLKTGAFPPSEYRVLPLLPGGARLLMDICYPNGDQTCHQVYVYRNLNEHQLASAVKAELAAAKWVPQGTEQGIATWNRQGRTLRYFLVNAHGNTMLYIIAPAILW